MSQSNYPAKKSRWQGLKEVIKPPNPSKRIEDAYGIIKEVGGISPLFNDRDLEARRKEIINVMYELNDLEFNITKEGTRFTLVEQKTVLFNSYKLARLFQLFFMTGSPWVRGKDNSELSMAVSYFIQNFEDMGDVPGAFRDLHSESINLLHLSWQGVDVTNTPGYLIQTTPFVMQPNSQRIDMSGSNPGKGKAPTGDESGSKHERV